MRWLTEYRKSGDIRIVRYFLLFPLTLSNKDSNVLNTRWLEWASWKQEYIYGYDGCEWVDKEWVD